VVPTISPQSAKINVSQPPWIRESQSRITGTSRLSAPSRVSHPYRLISLAYILHVVNSHFIVKHVKLR